MQVHHVALRTRRRAELRRFFETYFGFLLIHEKASSTWLGQARSCVLMLEDAGADEPAVDSEDRHFIAWRVDDGEFDRRRKQWQAAEILEDATEHTLYTRDPEGRRVGLSCHPLTVR